MRLAFVLPVSGGGGGAHSVVQEVAALRALGVHTEIFVNDKNIAQFRKTYGRFDWISSGSVPFTGPKDLAVLLEKCDIVVATTNTSVHSIAEALALNKQSIRTGYYVQDYEPLFYQVGSEHWHIALMSFSLLKGCTYFAKTHWLCDIVFAAHRHTVAKVTPSIDFGIYHPAYREPGSRRVITAMVRPATPRRAPRRTLRVLARLVEKYRETVDVRIFGSDIAEIRDNGMTVADGIEVLGPLLQSQVADLLKKSDFFLDLSDYQAFGRTAAEAMACGCVALAPTIGGASDFIVNGVNSFLTDTRDEGTVLETVDQILSMNDQEMRMMRLAGIDCVSGFTPLAAALSELKAFSLA